MRQVSAGDNGAEVLAYNKTLGCIIRLASTSFFCSSLHAPGIDLPLLEKSLANTVAACMYGNESLLFVSSKGGKTDFRLQEHAIISAPDCKLQETTTGLDLRLGPAGDVFAAVKVVILGADVPYIIAVTRSGSIHIIALMAL